MQTGDTAVPGADPFLVNATLLDVVATAEDFSDFVMIVLPVLSVSA
jgi:hypothetical protein